VVAALLSVIVPGVGQIYAGRPRRAAGFLAVVALGITVVAVTYVNSPRTLLKLAFEPNVLLSLLVVDVLALGFRAYSAVDAYRLLGAAPRSPRWVLWSTAAVAAVVVMVPHSLFAYYDFVQYDLINTVFVASPRRPAPTSSAAPTTAAPASTAVPASTRAPSTTVATTTTTVPPTIWDGLERVNILLLGSDAGVGRTGVRTDSMILASIDPDTGDLVLIGIPRNFVRVPLPETVDLWQCDCFPPPLNELYQYGEGRPDSFPGPATPGANAIKGAVAELVGVPVHFYALVALEGFVDVVDALGGVTITAPERVYDPRYPSEGGGTEVVDIQPGVYEFDGHQALVYARARYSSDDYNRMGRQRCVIEAMVGQADPFSLLRGFPQLAEVIKESVTTDIPLDAVPDLIDLGADVDTTQAVSIRLVPPTYITGRDAAGYNIPDVTLIREHAKIATTMLPAEAMELLGIDPLADACP
jgi:LCP family protein required for cell wall assembly